MIRTFKAMSAAALLAVGSCDVFEPQPAPTAGILAFHELVSHVTVPDTVAAGSAFEVRVDSFGGGCILKERTDVKVDGMIADLFVYDRTTGDDVCTADLRLIEHRATITFAQPGAGTVRFHGWRYPQNAYFAIERTVVVR